MRITDARVLLLLLSVVIFPKQALAWAWVGATPNPYARYDQITIYWSGGEDEVCNDDEWDEATLFGGDGFYGYQGDDYGNGQLSDDSADTSKPGSWTYYLDLRVSGDICDFDYKASSGEVSEAPHPAWLETESSGYVTPLSCNGVGGCTTAPWTYLRVYDMMDQWDNRYESVSHITENLTKYSDTCNVLLIEQDTYSDSLGRIGDYIRMCSSVCCGGNGSCQTEYGQDLYAEDYYHVGFEDIAGNCSGVLWISP